MTNLKTMSVDELEAWFNEICPGCKGEKLKGDCPTMLRAEIRRLRDLSDEPTGDAQ